jgi:hypothetical protein
LLRAICEVLLLISGHGRLKPQETLINPLSTQIPSKLVNLNGFPKPAEFFSRPLVSVPMSGGAFLLI